MKTLILGLFLSLTSGVFSATSSKEEWSEVVNGIRGRLLIAFDPDFLGTELVVVYLEIQNVSDVGNPKEIWFDPQGSFVEWNLRDESRKLIPKQTANASIMTTIPYWIALPHDSTLRFRVSVGGYGIMPNSGGMVFPLPGAFWLVPRRAGGGYELSATFASSAPKGDPRRAWEGKLTLPAAKVPERK